MVIGSTERTEMIFVQQKFTEVTLAFNIILSLSDKHGKYDKVVSEKEKIECLNFLGHKFDFGSESKIYSKGPQYIQIQRAGLSFIGLPVGFIKEKS